MRALVIVLFLLMNQLVYSQYAVQKEQFSLGERLNYKIKYGWFKIGEAHISIDEELHVFEGAEHYRIYFQLVTVGWLKIFADLDLDFESYINVKTLQPHHAKRITINGKKSNSQFDEFFYSEDSISVKTYKKENDQTKETSYEREGPYFTDALGTYFYARSKQLEKEEQTRLYIANRIYDFGMKLEDVSKKKNSSYYELIFPPIKQFPMNKKSYAILSNGNNIPLEIRLSTNDGNFFLILEN